MRKVAAAAIGAVCLAATQAARADGGPGPGVMQGGFGVAHGSIRYVAIPSARSTILEAIRRNGGLVERFRPIPGNWGIPIVAYDGTTEGLSRDGRTLILAQPVYGPLRKTTLFRIVDTKTLVSATIRLKGSFSFDALSPDGRLLYLVEHVSADNPTEYRVRAYNLRTGHLLARIVAEKGSWETQMAGVPASRLTARDATWAFTLYGGAGSHTFVHALDLRDAVAVCIDLPWRKQPERFFQFRLRYDAHGHVVVRGPRGRANAVIDPLELRVLSSVPNP